MSKWLKYFFGSFFSSKLARQGENRNFLNSILGLLLAVIFMVAGFTLGHNLAFFKFYNGAEEFSGFVANSLSDIVLTVDDETAYCGDIINTFADTSSSYIVNGYNLVVDTRDTSNLYDDFNAVCVSSDGTEISYEEYLSLSSSKQEDYTFKVSYTGAVLDIQADENQGIYTAYLSKLSDTTNAAYDEDVASSKERIKE